MNHKAVCKECGGDMYSNGTESTLVAYVNMPEGHKHDDNCLSRHYRCMSCKREVTISKRRRCPNPDCDWVGKAECFCHSGPKVDKWPVPTEEL